MKAADAAPREGEVPEVDDGAGPVCRRREAVDHPGQAGVLRLKVRHDGDGSAAPLLLLRKRRRLTQRRRGKARRLRLADPLPDAPEHVAEKGQRLALPLRVQQILHVGGEPADIA